MGIIDEIKIMHSQGRGDEEIKMALRAKGVNDRDIDGALAQTQIKDAVSQDSDFQADLEDQGNTEYSAQPQYEGMQPSMLTQEQGEPEYNVPQEQYAQVPQVASPYDAYGNYGQYQPYQEAMSSDVITEISEQVVSERLSPLQDKLEQAVNFKTIAETKFANLDERVKRFEQIIDKLQLSLLQKMGDYVNDVKDLKTEVIETQKSFKKLMPEMRKPTEKSERKNMLP